MTVAHEEVIGKTRLLAPGIADGVAAGRRAFPAPPPSHPGRTSAVLVRRGGRAPSAEEFQLPGYPLCRASRRHRQNWNAAPAAIRQTRAKICENYLRPDRAGQFDAKARDDPLETEQARNE